MNLILKFFGYTKRRFSNFSKKQLFRKLEVDFVVIDATDGRYGIAKCICLADSDRIAFLVKII